ncbi:MAG TPA: hypothetical protein VG266_04070 [Candidatus Dormibacteraeota bacterium]|jgi:hypothetical protein|nr:hypothetical protein [Candidatus Dormibacteraeota bacterium]
MRTTPDRVTISATVLALLCGAVLGLATFAGAAALWRAGQPRIGGLVSQSVLLAVIVLVSGVALLAQPARQRRARVPVGRALPHAWWPQPYDSLPALAACVGGPLFAGAGAAVLVFR